MVSRAIAYPRPVLTIWIIVPGHTTFALHEAKLISHKLLFSGLEKLLLISALAFTKQKDQVMTWSFCLEDVCLKNCAPTHRAQKSASKFEHRPLNRDRCLETNDRLTAVRVVPPSEFESLFGP